MPAFEVVGKIEDVEVIAAGNKIHDIRRLRKAYGPGRWRKLIGKREMKVKRLLG